MIHISTPNAIMLKATEPRSPEWYQQRRGGITATDLPKIMGLSGYGNALTVWNDKLGRLPNDGKESEEALFGRLLEPVVADEWARRNGKTLSTVGVMANWEEPWMRASCDRLIDGSNAALEVKTRNAYVAGKWRDDIPDDVLAQVAYQRMVGRFDYVEVACLIGGQHLSTYRYEKDTDLENLLANSALDVWEHVQAKTPPPVEWDAVLTKLMNELYPDRSGLVELPAATVAELVLDKASADSLARVAEAAQEAAKARIVHAMGEAEVITFDGEPVFTYRAQPKHSINVTDLEANDVELYEKVLAGGHINTTTSPVLRLAKGSKNVGV